MDWKRVTINTTEEGLDLVGYKLSEIGITQYELVEDAASTQKIQDDAVRGRLQLLPGGLDQQAPADLHGLVEALPVVGPVLVADALHLDGQAPQVQAVRALELTTAARRAESCSSPTAFSVRYTRTQGCRAASTASAST